MIKVYKLKIGEKVYEVELESITEKEGTIAETTPSQKKVETTATEGTSVEAPMQGVIVDVVVSVGDQVAAGDELVVLEAMKMENEIVSEFAGKVTSIKVKKGDNVDTDAVLVEIQ